MTDSILEIGGAGLESTDQKVRKLMDNLSSSQVPGYLKSEAVIRAFPLELAAATEKVNTFKPQVEGSFFSDVQGALEKTNSQLDLALASPGFFVLTGPWGEGYTRDGRFRLDNKGRLLTVAGNYPVLGQGGPIVVTPGAQVEFSPEGDVKVDGVKVDRIRVVKPESKTGFEPVTGSIFRKVSEAAALQEIEEPRLIQGYVESSNVNVVDETMEMIFLERIYGINAKIISTRDGNLTKLMDIARTQ